MRDTAGGALTSVTLPDTVTEIGQLAFYNCTALTTIDLSHVKTIASARCRLYGPYVRRSFGGGDRHRRGGVLPDDGH